MGGGNTDYGITNVAIEVKKYVGYATTAFLVACGTLVVLFAIYVGFRMAKAEGEKERQEAKQHLIYAIIGVIAIAIISVLIKAVIPILQNSKWNQTVSDDIPGLVDTLATVSSVVGVILEIIAVAAVAFAVYVGWQLMKAEDEKKRKDAKMQLLYTVIGVVGVVLINAIVQIVLTQLINGQKSA